MCRPRPLPIAHAPCAFLPESSFFFIISVRAAFVNRFGASKQPCLLVLSVQQRAFLHIFFAFACHRFFAPTAVIVNETSPWKDVPPLSCLSCLFPVFKRSVVVFFVCGGYNDGRGAWSLQSPRMIKKGS